MLPSCLAYSSTVRMEATYSSETSVDIHRATWRYIREIIIFSYKLFFKLDRIYPELQFIYIFYENSQISNIPNICSAVFDLLHTDRRRNWDGAFLQNFITKPKKPRENEGNTLQYILPETGTSTFLDIATCRKVRVTKPKLLDWMNGFTGVAVQLPSVLTAYNH